jgi:hypothetical protein
MWKGIKDDGVRHTTRMNKQNEQYGLGFDQEQFAGGGTPEFRQEFEDAVVAKQGQQGQQTQAPAPDTSPGFRKRRYDARMAKQGA